MPKLHHDWAAIRQGYETGPDPVPRICTRFGVARSTLYYRALKEGWRLRAPAIALGKRKGAWLLTSRATLIARLHKTLERQLDRIEQRLARAERGEVPEPSAEERERDAHTCGTLMRLLARLSDVARLDAKAAEASIEKGSTEGSNDDPELSEQDAERLRRDILRRVAEIASRGDA